MQPNNKTTEKKSLLLIQNRAKERISQITDYFQRKALKDAKKPLDKLTDVTEYKEIYSPLDLLLSNIVQNLANDFVAKKNYHFGYEKPAFDYGAGSKLVRQPCHCSGERKLSVQDKKDIRTQAENYLLQWEKAAKDWLHNGGNEIEVQILQTPKTRSAKPTMVERQSRKIIIQPKQ